jgi:ABC-type branched-subunit amino acid transport system permease subunit
MMSYFQLAYGWIRQEIFAQPARIIATIFFILLFCAPLITQERQYLTIITMATIFAIFAMSWDLISGVTGQLSLGHGLFFGTAAYAAALLNIHLGGGLGYHSYRRSHGRTIWRDCRYTGLETEGNISGPGYLNLSFDHERHYPSIS